MSWKCEGKDGAAGGEAFGPVFDVGAFGNFTRTLIGGQRYVFATGALKIHGKPELFRKHFQAQQIEARPAGIEFIRFF